MVVELSVVTNGWHAVWGEESGSQIAPTPTSHTKERAQGPEGNMEPPSSSKRFEHWIPRLEMSLWS